MKKVRYIGPSKNNLTYGKVYDLMEYIKYTNSDSDLINILNDHDDSSVYYSKYFIDVTAEYRNNVIDEILY